MKNDERLEIEAAYGTLVLDTKSGMGQYLSIAKKDYYYHRYSPCYLNQTRLGPIDRKAAKKLVKKVSEWIAQRRPSDRQVRYRLALDEAEEK